MILKVYYFTFSQNYSILLQLQVVCSDADEELLFNIPFTGDIKLKGLIVMGGEHGHHPAKVKL